ncbi:MAG TPA: hypothetical protein VHV47_00640 [Opitutaceae bacterium]|jgi:hypothetical protein|nr:hypothetical protein [Opitutaceae bacterium]
MKNLSALPGWCAALAVFAASTALAANPALHPVGPGPAATPAATGSLVVYSAYSPHSSWPSEPSYRQRYSDYDLQSVDGRALRSVSNDAGLAVATPAVVALAPGSYHVLARANGYGQVTVPVVIVAGRTTQVHLEGGNAPEPADPNRAVRLPDGRVVGWRAQS